WTLQQQGFDYAYDKRLYDRLRERSARPVREHLRAGLDYQDKLARFLENHDEPRAAATFPPAEHQAAAVISFLSPGLRFFHQGQFTGRKVRISPHLGRRPNEPVDESLARFYGQLLELLHHAVVRDGHWQALEPLPTWEGNGTHDCFVIGAWEGPGGERWLVPVNYADHASQCHVRLPFADLAGRTWRLRDRLRDESYDWQGGDLVGRGLYLDMPAWQASVYTLEPAPSPG
ncbi:MAG: alpha-amylase, partial [Pirellulales bacterium]